MTELQFRSGDNQFGLALAARHTSKLLEACQTANGCETGGLLIGYYNGQHDCAIVTTVNGPTADSRGGPTWFYRGTVGVQKMLDQYWHRQKHFYLGEWHFHPFASPSPSSVDFTSIRRIANSRFYNCPEPILLIIAGNPQKTWTFSALVLQRDGEPEELKLCLEP